MPVPTEYSDRLSLAYVQAAQAQKHVTVNETTRALDALVHMAVLATDVTDQPSSPTPGDGYLLLAAPTGADWSAFAVNDVVIYQDNAWVAYTPTVGMTVYVAGEATHRVWDGATWAPLANGAAPATADQFGVNASADATNRLTVKSDAVLFSHDDVTPGSGDVRHVLNKSAQGNTASLVFQTGYSGRAEFGLAGTDDFSIKVSPDGSTFYDGLVIDAATGAVTLPNTTPAVDTSTVAQIASGFTSSLKADLLANGGVVGGNLARTTQVVLWNPADKLQLVSASDRNVVEIFASGAALAAGTVFQRLFMSQGEIAVLTGVPQGAVIQSTAGVYGASGTSDGPMPLGLEAFVSTRFFFNMFRNGENGKGRVFVAAGAVAADVELLSGDGQTQFGTASIEPFGFVEFSTQVNAEHQIVATQPVFLGVAANVGVEPFDMRVIPPPASELIGYINEARISALYPNTSVTIHQRDGTTNTVTVSPGAPVNIAESLQDYRPNGAVILRADGPISCFSGADGEGAEATPHYPLSALSQRVPIPFGIRNTGRSANNSLAIASPYQGTARVYTAAGVLFATLPLSRSSAPATPAAQLFPVAALLGPDANATVALTGDLVGGYIEADVPIYVVCNSGGNQLLLTGGVFTQGDETALPGVTPEETRVEVRRDDAGSSADGRSMPPASKTGCWLRLRPQG